MATPKQLQKLTRDDVTKHNKDDDLVSTVTFIVVCRAFLLNFNTLSVGDH
jgi:hypothetical protein